MIKVAPVVTTTSINLSSNKIQNGDILVPTDPGSPGKKWLLKWRESPVLDKSVLGPIFRICHNVHKLQWQVKLMIVIYVSSVHGWTIAGVSRWTRVGREVQPFQAGS